MTYEAYKHIVEQALEAAVPHDVPAPLADAMRYSLLSGGKRLRAVMLLASCDMAGGDIEAATPFAAALEMLHAYSLIHDDLPILDNDDMRRGKPSCHKAFGEPLALLAGDGLLNLAFETMAASGHPRALPAFAEIAKRAGVTGMIAGQTLDVLMEGQPPERETVAYIHAHKTADLFIGAVAAGLLLAGADDALVAAGRAYALHFGVAFQIIDDLLDIEGDEALLGKTLGKDAREGKMTWPACVGVENARADAAAHTERAVAAISPFLARGTFLKTLAQNTLLRVQ